MIVIQMSSKADSYQSNSGIKDDAIVKDLDKFSIDQRCVHVDTMVEIYELLDKHAPLKNMKVVDRPLNE